MYEKILNLNVSILINFVFYLYMYYLFLYINLFSLLLTKSVFQMHKCSSEQPKATSQLFTIAMVCC